MPTSMNDLPYEIFSKILLEAIEANFGALPQYTYGLSQAPEPLKDVQMQRVVRGQKAVDALRWEAVNSIRQVNSQWHEWAVDYALREIYIRRWQGSERWMQSRFLDQMTGRPSGFAVYRDPYCALNKTVQLLSTYPSLAFSIRRLWFGGFYAAETLLMVFRVLEMCSDLKTLTLPWTVLRYGNAEDWSSLLGNTLDRDDLSSLELMAIDLKRSITADPRNQIDNKPLLSGPVDFSRLKRLKIFGDTTFMPVIDQDLFEIARSATRLEELHVTGTSSVTVDGVMAIVNACRETLRVLEYTPTSQNGFDHPDPSNIPSPPKSKHFCCEIVQCSHLTSLSISLPSICLELFDSATSRWTGEVQIRAGALCEYETPSQQPQNGQLHFLVLLDHVRYLMETREHHNAQLDIEIFVGHWIFEPRRYQVHGNTRLGEILSDGSWPSAKAVSSKGPYGHTGVYGKDEGPFSCISEGDYVVGLQQNLLSA